MEYHIRLGNWDDDAWFMTFDENHPATLYMGETACGYPLWRKKYQENISITIEFIPYFKGNICEECLTKIKNKTWTKPNEKMRDLWGSFWFNHTKLDLDKGYFIDWSRKYGDQLDLFN